MNYPLVQEIHYQDPLTIFSFFAEQTGAVFLDSAELREGCARYSFIAIDPFYILKTKNTSDPFPEIAKNLEKFPLFFHADLPPFQGGVAGFFSYDLCHHLEKLPRPKLDDMRFPDLALGFYDLVIGFDEVLKRAYIFSSGFPELEKTSRDRRAKKRSDWLYIQLEKLSGLSPFANVCCDENNLQSNFTRDHYQVAVQKVKDYILAGDIFEANISQRFKMTLPDELSPFDLYRRLRLVNAAPFATYCNFGDTVIASASPERFLKLRENKVETRPIKGTRPRGKTAEQDQVNAEELLQSEKDHAENVMIVDLLRNDLSRVCSPHSVKVLKLCGLESYATVHHLVSVVQGELRAGLNAIDLLRASFPGGSITGAPKIRAMEIISEIEPTCRGPYCGAMGYIGFNGDMDTAITIRTFAIKNRIATFQAGGAIVADSDPEMEFEETLTKAKALKKALFSHDFVN